MISSDQWTVSRSEIPQKRFFPFSMMTDKNVPDVLSHQPGPQSEGWSPWEAESEMEISTHEVYQVMLWDPHSWMKGGKQEL